MAHSLRNNQGYISKQQFVQNIQNDHLVDLVTLNTFLLEIHNNSFYSIVTIPFTIIVRFAATIELIFPVKFLATHVYTVVCGLLVGTLNITHALA